MERRLGLINPNKEYEKGAVISEIADIYTAMMFIQSHSGKIVRFFFGDSLPDELEVQISPTGPKNLTSDLSELFELAVKIENRLGVVVDTITACEEDPPEVIAPDD